MAEVSSERMKELGALYASLVSSSRDGSFGHFIRSELSRETLRKCGAPSVDLRYVTLESGLHLYSTAEGNGALSGPHVYATRFDDPVAATPERETACARVFVTTQPLRVVSAQRATLAELGRAWLRARRRRAAEGAASGEACPSEEEREEEDGEGALLQRPDGLSLLDFALYREYGAVCRGAGVVHGVAYDESAAGESALSRHLLLFSAEALRLEQELIYPSKRKVRRAADGSLVCASEPSRPQAPPMMMRRGKSVNTPPLPPNSPASALYATPTPKTTPRPAPPGHAPEDKPPPPATPPPPPPTAAPSPRPSTPNHAPEASKAPPKPQGAPPGANAPGRPTLSPRPSTPNHAPEERGEASKAPPKPQAAPRESSLGRAAASSAEQALKEAADAEETNTQM